MKYNLPWIVLCFCFLLYNAAIAQDSAIINCGQKEVNDRFLRENPTAKRLHDQIEFQIADYTRKVKAGTIPQQRITAVVTLPVVVHIIHNNGSENISDAQAITAIQNLNAAYANTGFYDPSNGVNTEIQFCLAQRDPNGNATNGITRNVSPYTVMGGPQLTSDDQNVKNLNRWNPRCYINIWLVRDIPGGVVGYAYLPSAHGSNLDGIVMEAGYFGSSPANDVVIIHEMGHYLGLYHTFDGGCGNTDCTTQGDRVCDTPPDQSTGWAACNTSVNSCSTDALSGFSTDVNDLKEDYMDYGNWNCMKVFTQGQKDRMIWHINNVRSSLLNCKSCLSPCPSPVIADFTQTGTNVAYGTTVNFTNGSTNGTGYRWYVNGVLQSTATNFSYTFNAGGTFNIRMVALSGSPLCDSAIKLSTVNVVCTAPVTAGFTSSGSNVPVGTTVNFTNSSVNASTYRWYINGIFQTTTANFSNTFNTAGIYVIRLAAFSNSPICDSSVAQDTIRVDCPVTASFTPLISTANVYQTINFTNSSTGATSYQWLVNGVVQGTATNFSFSFGSSGNFSIKLRATGATCTDSVVGTVVIEDTCSRETFQKSIGGPADDLSSDIQSTSDGGYIISGRTRSYGNGGEDGFIIKLDNAGTTQWSKTFGGAANDWFNAVITTSDGGYAAVGRTYSYGNARGDAWFVKMDANGNVQWSRRFSDNTSNGEDAHTLVQTPDGGYAVVGAHDAAPGVVNIFVIKLDAAGNILWNRIYDTGGTDGGMHIINDGSDLMVAGFTRTSVSYHDGLLLKLSGANGNIIWVKQYEVNGWNNTISRVFKQGTGYVVDMGALDDFSNVNTGRSMMMTVDANGNATSLKLVQTPQYRVGGNYLLPMEDGSFVTLYNEDSGDPDFNIISIGSNSAVQYARHYPRGGRQVNIMLRRANDGGFISVGYTGNPGNYDIYFVKTDIQGNSPGCDAVDLQVSVQTLQPQVTDGSWSVRSGNYQNTVLSNVLSTSPTPILTELCAGTSCTDPEPPNDDDTCNQKSSFQKRYGGTGEDVSMNVVATKDGGTLVIGHSNSSGAGNKDGYAIKYDKLGKVIWAKTYGGANEDILLRAKQTTDGGYIFGGYTRSYGNAAGDAWMVKTDADGNLQWSRRYGDGNPDGTSLIDMLQTSDGGYAFCGNHKNRAGVVDIMVVRTDATGTVLWSRGWGTDGSDESLGLTEDRDSLVVSAIYQSPTYYDAVLMKLNKTNGDIAWLKSWDFDNRANRLAWIFFQPDGYLVTGVNSDGFGILNPYHSVVKTDHNGNIIYTKELRATPTITNGYISPTRDGGFVIETIESVFNTTSDIYLSKSDKTGNVQWTRRFQNPGLQSYGGVMQTSDGVYVAAGTTNVGGNTDILLIRTDTSGNTVGCNSTLVPSNMRDPVITPLNFSWPRSFNIQFNANSTVNPQVADAVVSEVSQCEYIPCVEPPDDDTCTTRKSFLVAIGGVGNDEGFDVISTPDGGNLIAGTSNSSTGSNTDALITKTDGAGKVIWSKTYGGPGADVFYRIIPTRDGNYVAIGQGIFKAGHASDIFILKIDPLGNVIWSRAYGMGTLNGEVGRSIVQTADGGFAIAADYNHSPATVQPLYLKLDQNGILLWNKLLNVTATGQAYDVVTHGDLIIGTGVVAKAGSTFNDGYIIKFRSSDGIVLWTRNIESQGRSNRLQHMRLRGNELIFSMYNSDSWTTGAAVPVVFKTDTSGNILSSFTYDMLNITGDPMVLSSWPTSDGGFVTSMSNTTGNNNPRIVKFANDVAMQWGKSYKPYPVHQINSIIGTASGYTTVGKLARTAGGQTDIVLMKTDLSGMTTNDVAGSNCAPSSLGLPATWNVDLTSTPAGANYWSGITSPSLESLIAAPNIISYLLPTEALCMDSTLCDPPTPPCDSCAIDTLIGRDTVCNFTDSVTYELKRTGTCTQPVEWTIDGNYATIGSVTDSTVKLIFKQTGSVWLYAKITTACDTLTDSTQIHIFDSPDTLNLGPDIAICKISTWPLNARSGFKSYVWQDGSMDSTFTADQPGIYHVTVTDYCGNQLRDTVVITLAPDVPFDLGPDITICNEDTVTLTAPTGFTNYYWSPTYRVSNSYTREIKVNPDRDTTYTVVAERGPGCLVTDTIRVKVNRPTPLDLGIDKAFCRNDSVLLDAGPAFSDYLWNNNLTTQQIYAKTGGSYHVKATDINGCISKDTVNIVMKELPFVNIGGDTIICRNTGVLFNAGIGSSFNIFLWQDGSTNNTYFGTQAGTYWVQVTNANNCKNSDTVKIIRVAELPANFLADTIGICDGEQIELRASGSFVSYQWDGLFNTPTITVKDESGHVLKVTDEYGCSGEDTIRVYFKYCRKRIWFPNAITPNNDAHNSTFKPIVDGGLVKFHLVIYNRWGQKIFETQDAKRGWDGTVSGHTQDTNTFVWVCTYKFVGRDQVEHVEKGFVIVVK